MEDEEFIRAVKNNPKIFMGYSDTTNNHLMLNKLGLSTFYGPCFLTDIAELDKEMLPYTKNYLNKLLISRSGTTVLRDGVRLAIAGSPNVGKSSLVNALLGEERLMTSPIAGTTRDAVKIEFAIHNKNGEKIPVQLVDTAGLRKTGKVDNVVELFSIMRAKSAIDRADVVIMVLEAGFNKATAQDRKIAALIEQSGRSCVIAANKCDLCSDEKKEALLKELYKTLPGLNFAPAAFISAKEKRGLDKLEEVLSMVAENLKTEITTGLLNRVLTKAFEDTPPPVIKGIPLKLFYASLAGVRPVKIKLFVNRVESAAGNYLTFLKKRIRDNFPLEGIPLDIEAVARPKKIESIRRHNTAGKK